MILLTLKETCLSRMLIYFHYRLLSDFFACRHLFLCFVPLINLVLMLFNCLFFVLFFVLVVVLVLVPRQSCFCIFPFQSLPHTKLVNRFGSFTFSRSLVLFPSLLL